MKLPHPFLWLTEPGQPRAFAVTSILALLTMASLQVLDAPLHTAAAPAGIISFQFARDLESAHRILASWGPEARVYAGLSLGVDYLFMVAYACALGLGCVLVARRLGRWDGGLAALGMALSWGQWMAALLDALENYALIRLLLGSERALWPALAYGCALPKFLIVGEGILFIGVGGILSLLRRSG
uniref:Hypothetical conserved protein n=1 Tax=uncultured prokaryote TaxID=198431 RepID=H5SKB7_9ZZZZ|nr:hypothetical conserved protein [uncultured prokaryote]